MAATLEDPLCVQQQSWTNHATCQFAGDPAMEETGQTSKYWSGRLC